MAAVVADIGPGVNPYHEAFRRPGWTEHPSEVIPGFPAEALPLEITLGDDYGESREADTAIWEGFEEKQLYWIPNTNLLLYAHRPQDWRPDGTRSTFHGTGSAHAVEKMCNGCYVLVVMDRYSLDGEPTRLIAEEMPWVDAVTSTNVPGDNVRDLTTAAYADATRSLHQAGRLQFGFAGNTPVATLTPFPFPHVSLPPWVVMVGGAHSSCSGTEVNAGKPTELVGNFTQRLAGTETVDGYVTFSGTSFATPQLAGAFGSAVLDVRRDAGDAPRVPGPLWTGQAIDSPALEDGELTAPEVRDALNRSATWFETQAFDPTCDPGFIAQPAPASQTPWVEMGWGYVGPDQVDRASDVLLGLSEPHERPAEAAVWMETFQGARSVPYEMIYGVEAGSSSP